MKLFKRILIVALLATIGVAMWQFFNRRAHREPVSAATRMALEVMPLPAKAEIGPGSFFLNRSFAFQFTGYTEPRLERAAHRMMERLAIQTELDFQYQAIGGALRIYCEGAASEVQQMREDESYTLKVTEDGISLSAKRPYGILRGLETLLQLAHVEEEKPYIPEVLIKDQPRFPWRGILIDACRHWIPKKVILENLDAMSAAKLNVLHWHLTEDQGFRVESKQFPKLHEMASDGNYYTQEDIREVVQYARDRGIRVVPEFDLPGHSTSWLVAYPEFGSQPGPYELERKFGIHKPTLDPTNEAVYEFLDTFFGEMATLFPDAYLHIGGDEVKPDHWKANESIQAFIAAQGLEDEHGLQAYFNQRLQKILAKYGKTVVGWDEVLHEDLPKEIVVQSWRGQESLFNAVRQGFHGILSSGYYLDFKLHASEHYQVDPTVVKNAVDIEPSEIWETWQLKIQTGEATFEPKLTLFGEDGELRGVMEMLGNMTAIPIAQREAGVLTFEFESEMGTFDFEAQTHDQDLTGEISMLGLGVEVSGTKIGGNDMPETSHPEIKQIEPLTPEQESRILGGEACMWAEVVDARNITSRIWPRAGVIGEKFWTPGALTQDEDDMYRRMEAFSDYLHLAGMSHRSYRAPLLLEISQGQSLDALTNLVEVLEEIKYYQRHRQAGNYHSLSVLNQIVDAAPAESREARRFNQLVETYLAHPEEDAVRQGIATRLNLWKGNHQALLALIETEPRVEAVAPLSEVLMELSRLALTKLDGNPLDADQVADVLQRGSEQMAGVELALMPGFQALLTAEN
ncbi:family 20 glycosylhydrolase [Pontibacter sp. G13]|uniref:beta-N-acetylhexosaminidase n=1 Tax=Pontibacter sp. G13 TaxID=3074898 RepID=UPI00288B75EC|nr:family 20 glycosylhydrolase [Pontibacter sp. G13]WNJ21074.1 family 20 glycosylhydrolase [Pontibacter sp. G13]